MSSNDTLTSELFNQTVDLGKVDMHPLRHAMAAANDIVIDVLRLDRIHPVISGNKWFKLKYHLQQALQQRKKGIVTFGGAWSNHLVATAFACRQAGLPGIGIIRGEAPATPSATLQEAAQYGMQLKFVSRSDYGQLQGMNPDSLDLPGYPDLADYYVVPMGGQSAYGVQGASEILSLTDLKSYSHIACAVGTGTMLAGLVRAGLPHQQVIGISSLKMPAGENNSLNSFVSQYTDQRNNFTIFFDYHFGGYARKTDSLIAFMNTLWQQYALPTDFVYTGKCLFGVMHLLQTGYFEKGSRILVIHSGGLQGNRSLPAGTLTFL